MTSMGGRILYLDTAKVIAMFLVVFAHLFSTYSQTRLFIYAFHMPFFFLLSGVFHKNNGKIDVNSPFKRLIIPCIFYSCLYIAIIPIIDIIIGKESITNYFHEVYALSYKTIYALITGGDMANIPCWFFVSLFSCRIIMDLLLKIRNNLLQAVGIMLIIVIAMKIHLPFFLNSTAMIFPFYFIGYFCADKIKRLKFKNIHLGISLLLIILSVVISLANGRVSVHGFNFGNLPYHLNVMAFYVNASLGSIALLLISAAISCKQTKIISSLAATLIPIVGLQWLFIAPYQFLSGFRYDTIIPFLYSLFIIVTSYYISKYILVHIPVLSGYKE